jgi:tRNA threonylcarbamoyl adenosine modification protein YeaZ
VEKTHGQIIIKKISDLLDSAGGSVKDLQAIVVATGPGSFTGLRIGLAAAKGIAAARDLSIIGVSVFDIAAPILRVAKRAWLLVPSRQGEYYLGEIGDGVLKSDSLRLIAEAELPELIGPGPAYGVDFDPTVTLSELLPNLTGGQLEYDAADLLAVGLDRLVNVGPTNLAELEPIYLQKAIAEVRFDERQRGTE